MAGRTRTPASLPRESRRERRVRQREAERARPQATWEVPALLVVFLLSGGAGLIHEVVWARLLGHLFGATTLAVCTVLAAYMGGLALGSYWIGRRIEGLRDRRRTYALLEIGIGIFALLVPLLLHLTEPLYGAIWRRYHFSFAVLSVFRFVLAGGLLVVPTFMMGATFPVLADYLAGRRERAVAPQWLYAVNLAGAVLGTGVAGFVLMPTLGVWRTIIAGAMVNIGVGLAVLLMREPATVRAAPPPPAGRPSRLLLTVALISGATSMVTQVAWTRVLVLVVGSTTYAFSTMLLVYLVALAAGSAVASRGGARLANVVPALAVMNLLMALCLLGAVYAVDHLPAWYVSLFNVWRPQTIAGMVGVNTIIVFAILFWPVLFAGTVLPLTMIGALPPSARRTGLVVGGIYAINTVGAILGAVLSGFVLVPHLGTERTLLGVVVATGAVGAALALCGERRRWLARAAPAVAALLLVASVVTPDWHQKELNSAVFEIGRLGKDPRRIADPNDQILYHREGSTAAVQVLERGGERAIRINGRINASDGVTDMPTQVLLAQLPLVLAPRTDDVFVLGWGSGVTAGAALQSPAKRVTAVELEPAVVEASQFFLRVNHDPLRDPRLHLLQDDARHLLLASPDMYDVMISEPSHPWVAGVANLFTQDFFALAARRLRDDGIFSQWLQGYQISIETFRTILATFQSVFPEVIVFSPSIAADWLLLGSRQPLRFDLLQLEQRWADEATRAENARVGVKRPEYLVAGVYLGPQGVRALTEGARINTDDNMDVEFTAPREMTEKGGESGPVITEYVGSFRAPVESVLADPSVLLDSRDRLQALIAGLEAQGLPTDRYEELLEALP